MLTHSVPARRASDLALSSRAWALHESGRCDGAFCYGGPGRGADHRAGRGSRESRAHGAGDGQSRARSRGQGPGPSGALVRGTPDQVERQEDHSVFLRKPGNIPSGRSKNNNKHTKKLNNLSWSWIIKKRNSII